MADLHLDDELRVDQTTPQGSQDHAVEVGHEERDANVGGIMKWLVGTGAIAVTALILVTGIYKTLETVTNDTTKPPPLYQEAKLPPAPYIEGLVVEGERAGMTEHLARARTRENDILKNKWKLGETDPDTQQLPLTQNEASEIVGAPKGDTKAVDQMFTQGQISDASGGLRTNVGR
ncbi:MAG TPA: hypothetical protein VF681_04720 [Abditibacteriaceae bacterium]|jgi:hypothetical protein